MQYSENWQPLLARLEPRLTGIAVGGFKSLRTPQFARVGAITVLAGPNSSGKSSLLQPLLLLKQTLEAPYDPGSLQLFGNNVKFSEVEQVLSHGKNIKASLAKNVTLRLDFSDAVVDSISFTFSPDSSKRLTTSAVSVAIGDTEFELRPDMPSEEIGVVVSEASEAAQSRERPDSKQFAYLTNFTLAMPGAKRVEPTWGVQRSRCFLVPYVKQVQSYQGLLLTPNEPVFSPIAGAVSELVTKLIHLPGLRGNPERTYPVTAVGERFQGSFEEYAASVIATWQEEPDSQRLQGLQDDLQRLELTWKVAARRINATQVELKVGRTQRSAQGGAMDLVNIVDVGFGLSQSLPVLVALHAANAGDVLYIEQPEIHLHPRAQHRLASAIVSAAKRGVRIIIETHSSLLILGLQTLVAKGEIDPSSIALHWLSRDKSGFTKVATADLGPDGSFGDWPADFDDVTIGAQSEYVEAAATRLMGESDLAEAR